MTPALRSVTFTLAGALALAACGTVEPGDEGASDVRSTSAAQKIAPATAADGKPVPLSGEDMFRGLYFAEGPAAERMGDLFGPVVSARKKRIEEMMKKRPPRAEQLDATFAYAEKRLLAAGMQKEQVETLLAQARRQATATPEQKLLLMAEAHQQLITHVMTAIPKASPDFFARFGAEMQSGDEPRVDAAMREASKRITTAMLSILGPRAKGKPGAGTPISTDTGYDLDTVVDLQTADLTVAQLYDATIENVAVESYLVELYNILVYYDIYFAVNQVIYAVAAVGYFLVGVAAAAVEFVWALVLYEVFGMEQLPAMPYLPRAADTSGLAPDVRLHDEMLIELITTRFALSPG